MSKLHLRALALIIEMLAYIVVSVRPRDRDLPVPMESQYREILKELEDEATKWAS